MKQIILLAAVVMLSVVIGHETKNFAEDEEETEPPTDDTARHVSKRIYEVTCGLLKINPSHVKRGDSRFPDEDTSDDSDDDPHNLDKILGGTYATYGEIPWQVHILYDGGIYCGGAVIGEFWVLSAAHCFVGSDDYWFSVRVGDHSSRRVEEYEKVYNVSRVIKKENFIGMIVNDIALVKIKATDDGRGIRFNDYVQPICLPNVREILKDDSMMLVSGYGRSNGGRYPGLLKKSTMYVISHDTCQVYYYDTLPISLICVSTHNEDSKVCTGDSGGPAAGYKDGSYVLFGIIIFNNGDCGSLISPSGLTKVSDYVEWINYNIGTYGNGTERDMPIRGGPERIPK